jgi:hypothetical protein
LEQDISEAGLRVVHLANLTPEVLRALQRTSDHYRALAASLTPRILHPAMLIFAATEGSSVYQSFVNRERIYPAYHLQTPG